VRASRPDHSGPLYQTHQSRISSVEATTAHLNQSRPNRQCLFARVRKECGMFGERYIVGEDCYRQTCNDCDDWEDMLVALAMRWEGEDHQGSGARSKEKGARD